VAGPDAVTTTPDAPETKRSFTPRALILGLGLALLFAVATPLNDYALGNTFFYGNFLPPGVTGLVLLLGLGLNPLLGRRRLNLGETTLIVSLVLVVGGVAGGGLNRTWAHSLIAPARILPTDPSLAPLLDAQGQPLLPKALLVGLPDQGPLHTNDPEYRLVVDGFANGLSKEQPSVVHRATVSWTDDKGAHTQLALGGDAARRATPGSVLDLESPLGRALQGQRLERTPDPDNPGRFVLRPLRIATPAGSILLTDIQAPGIPWAAWFWPWLHWLPFLIGAVLACLSIGMLVRRQWMEHERLPYPIAAMTLELLRPPEAGARLAPLFRQRGFWLGFAVAALVLGSQALKSWGYAPLAIPTHWDFNPVFSGDFWQNGNCGWWLFNVRVYFSVAALMFFLPLDLSFSLWFFFAFTWFVTALLFTQGLPVDWRQIAAASSAGYAVQCLLILWVGRGYYLRLARAALAGLLPAATDDEQPHLRAAAPYVWLLLAGALAMGSTLVLAGALLWHATIVVLLFLGVSLVLARIVAEAGSPFILTPCGFGFNDILFSLTGFQAPVAALTPLLLVGFSVMGDSRENLLPFAVNAGFLQNRRDSRLGRWNLLVLATVILAATAGLATMVMINYRMEHVVDGYAEGIAASSFKPITTAIANGGQAANAGAIWVSYGVGAVITAILGAGRLLFA